MFFKNLVYIMISIFLLILILEVLNRNIKIPNTEEQRVVVVPGYNNLFSRPFFRRGIRHYGLPWVGPRVGGYYVGPYGKKYRAVGRKRLSPRP